MEGISLLSAEEAQSSSFGLLEEDDYRVRIESFSQVNRGGLYAKLDEDGNPLPTIDFILKPMGFADDEDAVLVDQDGEPLNPEKHLIFFYDPHRLGTRPQVSRSRKFLASVLGIAPDSRVELPGGLGELIGKELIATVSIKNGKNNIVDTRPLKKRARVRVAAPEAVVEEPESDETDAF